MLLRLKTPIIKEPTKLVAIVVPLSRQPTLTPDEQISLRHLIYHLGRYDKYVAASRDAPVNFPGFRIKRFPDKFFGSVTAHARMIMSPKFYEEFSDYKYILMYHLDSLVFSDQLKQWCEKDLDYIGAPWIKCKDMPWVDVERVGNSGFALIKIASFLKVLYSPTYSIDPDEYWQRYHAGKPRPIQYFNLPKKYLKRLRIFNCSRWQAFRWLQRGSDADVFWSDEAIRYYPEFRIASLEMGLRFAFEFPPRLCFERNHRTLPFGCHGWPRYDRAFWEPYLLKDLSAPVKGGSVR